MDATGKWNGVIVYGEKYREHAGKELHFDMEISQHAEHIQGSAIDTKGFGVSPDKAVIKGTCIGNRIDFIKQYPSLHYYDRGKIKVDRSRPGYPIEYSGSFDATTHQFSGDWSVKCRVKLLGLFPIEVKASGTWTMQKTLFHDS